MPLRPYLLPILVFLLAGPPLGLLVAYAGDPALGWKTFNLFALVALSYLFGGLHALSAGVCYVLLWPLIARLPIRNVRILGCMTGLAGTVPMLAWLAGQSTKAWTVAPFVVQMLPAAVCGVLAARWRATTTGRRA